MADFCTRCSREMFGEVKPEIDLKEISKEIEDGFYKGPYLCEGCGYINIYNDNGVMRVYTYMPDDKIEHFSVSSLPTLDEFLNKEIPRC